MTWTLKPFLLHNICNANHVKRFKFSSEKVFTKRGYSAWSVNHVCSELQQIPSQIRASSKGIGTLINMTQTYLLQMFQEWTRTTVVLDHNMYTRTSGADWPNGSYLTHKCWLNKISSQPSCTKIRERSAKPAAYVHSKHLHCFVYRNANILWSNWLQYNTALVANIDWHVQLFIS